MSFFGLLNCKVLTVRVYINVSVILLFGLGNVIFLHDVCLLVIQFI